MVAVSSIGHRSATAGGRVFLQFALWRWWLELQFNRPQLVAEFQSKLAGHVQLLVRLAELLARMDALQLSTMQVAGAIASELLAVVQLVAGAPVTELTATDVILAQAERILRMCCVTGSICS